MPTTSLSMLSTPTDFSRGAPSSGSDSSQGSKAVSWVFLGVSGSLKHVDSPGSREALWYAGASRLGQQLRAPLEIVFMALGSLYTSQTLLKLPKFLHDSDI